MHEPHVGARLVDEGRDVRRPQAQARTRPALTEAGIRARPHGSAVDRRAPTAVRVFGRALTAPHLPGITGI